MTTHFPHDDDPLAARLRDALSSEAEMVHPSDDGLQRIRDGIEEGGRPWWRHPAALSVAAAVVLGALVGGGLALTGGDGDSKTVVADDPTATPTPAPTPSESEGTPSPTPSPMQDVWVYYVLDDPAAGPRLYREQHLVEAKDVPTAALALTEMFTGPAADPDYSSPWPTQPLLRGYTVDGEVATVDLAEFPKLGSETEGAAVQQLVYTVTANDPSVKRVRMLVDGAPPEGAFDWSQPVKRSAALDVQGLVWLLEPRQGAEVSSPVRIAGFGTAFEGTVSWEVRREGSDEVVKEGFAQAGSNGEFGEFTDTVELPPGTYEMRAFESSAQDGSPLHVDSKVFTVS